VSIGPAHRGRSRVEENVCTPFDGALANMAHVGLDSFTLNVLHDCFIAYSRDWGDVVTDAVPRIVGAPARSIADFARDSASAFGGTLKV
jgi:hypothetical protein